MKLVFAVCALTMCIWLTHNNYLVKISKLEKNIIAEKRIIEDLKKELNEKQLEYEKAIDLKKMEVEMREKNIWKLQKK